MKPDLTCNVVRRLAKILGSSCSIDPSSQVSITADPYGTDLSDFRRDYLLYNITRKISRKGDAKVTRQRAWNQFVTTEQANAIRNANIRAGVGLEGNNRLILQLIRARGVIAQVLGKFRIDDVLANSHFTNGASTSRTRASAFVELKTVPTWDRLKCTKNAYPFYRLYTANHCLAYAEAEEADVIRGVEFNEFARWDSVPKDREIDRSIIVGNDVNVMLQRGCGIYIRERLKKYGIDLTDQTRNQELARMASITGKLVTHDAVDSSNRIVTECVRLLLPDDWFDYMAAIAERLVVGEGGQKRKLQLFSSMGNGFTFELQSLIYFGLAVSSGSRPLREAIPDIGIFGDDVIMPVADYDNFLECITFFGMAANEAKTFRSGPFRESCGAHWYEGVDVAPFFIRSPFDKKDPRPMIKFLNDLVDWYYGQSVSEGNPELDSLITDCIKTIDPLYRNTVPRYMSNTSGLYFDHPLLKPIRFRQKNSQLRLCFRAIVEKSKDYKLHSVDDLPWYLYVLWSGNLLEGRRALRVSDGWACMTHRHPVGRVSMHGLPWTKVRGCPGRP